jgi:thymidylate synthase (FAD)
MSIELIGTKINVLDRGSVELIDLMPNSNSVDLAVVQAARVSFLGESKGDDLDKKLLHYLLRHRHTSPFEMVEMKFRVDAPVVTWWQWVRHRTFSFNFSSGRYTEFPEDSFYIPLEWRKQSQSNKQASDGVLSGIASLNLTNKLLDFYENSDKLYREALAGGVAREQARLFLPGFSAYYSAIVKCDAHNLMNFMRLRLAKDAQYEIRVYAQAIYKIFKQVMPWTADYLEKEDGWGNFNDIA